MSHIQELKCVVWDLDGTVWEGVLLEGDTVRLRPGIKNIIESLDNRGILHSIASKNDHQTAVEQLRRFGLKEYFLYPEINWNAKSISIDRIRDHLNIQKESMLFIDDEPCERDEVQGEHPEVTCLDARDCDDLLTYPRLNPRFITEDSGKRRRMYLAQMERERAQEEFLGPRVEFLASLKMRFTISKATEKDLQRAEELTVRTNQLNTTGRTYDYDALIRIIESPEHDLLVCELTDRYGYHGKIGLALIERLSDCHHLRLLLMSCRVMSLGVGTILLAYLMRQAKEDSRILRADFRHTGRNRPMFITFKMSNFKEVEGSSHPAGNILLENDLSALPAYPSYVKLFLPKNRGSQVYG